MRLAPISQTLVALSLALSGVAANAGAVHDSSLFTTVLPGNDDGSTAAVNLGFAINFFGTNASQTYVNNNGNITFTSPLATFTPFGIQTTNFPIIAPYFADVDTRVGNVVTYGSATLGGRNVFGVNWINVGYFSTHVDLLNTFQLILTDRSDVGAGDFDIQFNYDKIQWETGDASGGSGGFGGTPAAVGYTAGDSINYFEFPGSRVTRTFEDTGSQPLIAGSRNSNILGQYNFSVRGGQVIPDVPAIPEPETYAMMALGLGMMGWVARRRRAKA